MASGRFSNDDVRCRAELFQCFKNSASSYATKQGKLITFSDDELSKLVSGFIRAKALCIDSRLVGEKDVFIALPGSKVNGGEFVKDVFQTASFLIVSNDDWHGRAGSKIKDWFLKLPSKLREKNLGKWIVVSSDKIEQLSSCLAAPFYGYPCQKLNVVGVTGTNGKTSLCYLLERLYQKEKRVGVIGTIEARFPILTTKDKEAEKKIKRIVLPNTTPHATLLQHLLAQMVFHKVEMVFIELSSHALALGRTRGISIDSLLWSNLTKDHLDFHKTMREYYKAKCLAFDLLKKDKRSFVLVCLETLSGYGIVKDLQKLSTPAFLISEGVVGGGAHKKNAVASLKNPRGDFFYKKIKMDNDLCTFSLDFEGADFFHPKNHFLQTDFFGAGALQNISLALCHRFLYKNLNVLQKKSAAKKDLASKKSTALLQKNIDWHRQAKRDLDALKGLTIPGRMQRIDDHPIFIDYAHTPDALVKAIKVLQEIKKTSKKKGKLIVVFGCGGDRDREKRGPMGAQAFSFCDVLVVTSDNPRNENPLSIIADILKPISSNQSNKRLVVIPNRKEAIAYAVSLLNGRGEEENMVLLAGKGHESYQIDHLGKKPFDEVAITRQSFSHFLQNGFLLSEIISVFDDAKLLVGGRTYDAKKFLKSEAAEVKKLWKTEGCRLFFSIFFGISTDSRTIEKEEIFFAFDGALYRAVDYIDQVLKKGARLFVVDKKHFAFLKPWSKNNAHVAVLFVNDVFLAYRQLAAFKMRQLKKRGNVDACRIAVTGSAGKSSLKQAIGHVLSKKYDVFVSKGNYNNHVGVPHNVFAIDRFYEIYVFEMGMSGQGEIASLSEIILPHAVLLTNVLSAHIENFSNVKQIALAKAEFFPYGNSGSSCSMDASEGAPNAVFQSVHGVSKGDGVNSSSFQLPFRVEDEDEASLKLPRVFLPYDINFRSVFRHLACKYKWAVTWVDSQMFLEPKIRFKSGKFFTHIALKKNPKMSVDILGLHPYASKMFSLIFQLALFLKFDQRELFQALSSLPSSLMARRFEIVKQQPCIIDDSYNANPTSMIEAIDFVAQASLEKKTKGDFIFVLGDMCELGAYADYHHEVVVQHCLRVREDRPRCCFIFFGHLMTKAWQRVAHLLDLKNGDQFFFACRDFEKLTSILKKRIGKSDTVYFKASNASNLKRVIDRFI